MKAVRIHEDGGPEVLRYEEAPDPEAGSGDVLIRLRAASLNHLDVWVRKGLPSVPKPRILGADGAGVVEAVGDGVTGFAPGERVVINPGLEHDGRISVVGEHFDGTHAELIALGADAAVPTADAAARVKEITEGRGADVVVEHVGEATWATSLQVSAQGGRVVVCGATSGPNPPAALHRIWWKQLTVYGSTMGTKDDFEGAYELVRSGRARPVVDEVLPLAEARAAHERLEAGEQLGKIVLRIPG